jgi:hypothetical protein
MSQFYQKCNSQKIRILGVLTILMMVCIGGVSAGLVTSGYTDPTDLAQSLAGSGVSISNVQLTNGFGSYCTGAFNGGTGIIGFEEGIILSSGSYELVVGPNDNPMAGLGFQNSDGDADLDALTSGNTIDACVLEFDVVPQSNVIQLDYVFTSDEYKENLDYDSFFNDVFGLFVNGQNVAVVPTTSLPVAISNINSINNNGYFIDNDFQDGSAPLDTQMDGLTKVFRATATVTQNQVNHIKLAIADGGSSSDVDSNVFIKAGSLTLSSSSPVPEFPSAFLPATMIIGFLGAVLLIQRTREH